MRRGIYRFSNTAVTQEAELWVALLCAGEGAVLSHFTAAGLWQLMDLKRSAKTYVTVPCKRYATETRGLIVHRTRVLDLKEDVSRVRGLLCTSLPRTLIDLASVMTPDRLEVAYDAAARRHPKIAGEVLAAIRRLKPQGREGIDALRTIVLREELGPTGSHLEAEVRIAMRNAGIPTPVPQMQITDAEGEQIGVFDFVWPERRFVLFVDGWQAHGYRAAFEKDKRQKSALAAEGWQSVEVTHRRLEEDLPKFLSELKAALGVHADGCGSGQQP